MPEKDYTVEFQKISTCRTGASLPYKNRSLADYLLQLLDTDNSVGQSTLQQFEEDYHGTTVKPY